MTLELWNTFATFGTFVVIAATAMAALVQLRHLRSGNQINAMINLGNQFDDKQFREARYLALANIASALADEAFRNYSLANSRGIPRPAVSQELIEIGRAAVLVGNFYEELGILVKHGAIDRDLVLDRWSANVRGAWRRMAPYVAWLRRAENSEAVWENFEYLTVLAEDWSVQHASGAHPQDVRRLPMPETYPVPPPV